MAKVSKNPMDYSQKSLKFISFSMSCVLLTTVLVGIPWQAHAADATGSIFVRSSTVTQVQGQTPAESFRNDLDIGVTLRDDDGIASSSLECTYSDGSTAFTLSFGAKTTLFTWATRSTFVTNSNFRFSEGPQAGRFDAKRSFDIKIAARWTRNESCTAETQITDRFGTTRVIDTQRIALSNPGIPRTGSPQPNSQPTPSSTPSLISTMCQPPQDMMTGSSDQWSAFYSSEVLTVTVPEDPLQPLCEIGYKLLINSGGANFQAIELNVPMTKRTIKLIKRDSLELVLERTFYHSEGPLAYMTINGERVRGIAKQFRSPKYLVLVNNQETLDTKEELSAALTQNSKKVATRLASFSYTYCYEINEFLPNGIASKKNSKHKKAFVSSRGYALNKKLDKDKDGVVCEK